MIKVTEEQFEEFKHYVYNYMRDLKVQVNTVGGNAVYKTEDKVYGRHWFDYDGLLEIDEDIYHKLFETEFMNNVRKSMNFCKGCYQLIFKKDMYCSDKCKSKCEKQGDNMSDITFKYFNKLHNLINEEENDDMTTVKQEYKDSLQEKIDALQRELDSLKVNKEWYEAEDSLVFESGEFKDENVEFSANYNTWENSKRLLNENEEKDVFYIEVIETPHRSASTAITLNQMIQLRDYLTHKIEYLQS